MVAVANAVAHYKRVRPTGGHAVHGHTIVKLGSWEVGAKGSKRILPGDIRENKILA